MLYEIRLNDTKYMVEVDDVEARLKKEKIVEEEDDLMDIPDIVPMDEDNDAEEIRTTMPGQVISVLVKPGDQVAAGAPLLILESMKMENTVSAEKACTIVEVAVRQGEFVGNGGILFRVTNA